MSLGFTRGSMASTRATPRAPPPPLASKTTARVTTSRNGGEVVLIERQLSARPAPKPREEPTALEDSPRPPNGSIWGLFFLNIALFAAHLAGAIVTGVATINYPLTIFETRLTDDAIGNFTCIYDYGEDESGEAFCSDPSLTLTGNTTPPTRCVSVLSAYNQSMTSPLVTPAGGPSILAYELTHFALDDVYAKDEAGVLATRWILFSIELVTCLFHLVYALTFGRMLYELPNTRVFDRMLLYGGVPARWIEYSFSASLMSFFIANTAAVYDFYALLAFALATFGLMYFGMIIEHMVVIGRCNQALMLLYIPSMALFILTWLPPMRQLWTDIFRLSCRTWQTSSLLGCSDDTCFGAENPIIVFVLTLVFLFCTFPLALLFKVYYIGGWSTAWGRVPRAILRQLTFVRETRGATLPLFWCLYGGAQFLMWIFFVLWVGWMIAVYRLLCDIVWPILPFKVFAEPIIVPAPRRVAVGFIAGEYIFSLLSATTKIFLLAFFLSTFAQRDW